jgi:hypothetical protein
MWSCGLTSMLELSPALGPELAAIATCSGRSQDSQMRYDLSPLRKRAGSLSGTADPQQCLLVLNVVALMIGLGAVSFSLAPAARGVGKFPREMQHVSVNRDSGPATSMRMPGDVLKQPLAVQVDPAAEHLPASLYVVSGTLVPKAMAARARPGASRAVPRSPLFPAGRLTMWTWVLCGPLPDRQAFLLGAAIQVHAPAHATTANASSDMPRANKAEQPARECRSD